MIGSIRVLIAQLAPRTHDVRANLETACHLIDEHPDASLAVFPELFVQSYALKGIEPLDVDEPGGPIASLQACARRNGTSVVIGVAERTDFGTTDEASGERVTDDGPTPRRGAMANTALCIDETGEIAARYRKVHLFDAERRWFAPGDEYVTVGLSGVSVAPLLCYDVEFPEPSRAAAVAGAELLVTISANMDPYLEEHALFLRSRALENGVPHVYVNRVGEEAGVVFCGGSGVADSRGRLLVEMPPYLADARLVTVPLERGTLQWRADRRPDVGVRQVSLPART